MRKTHIAVLGILLLVVALAAAYSYIKTPGEGDTVRIHYTLTLDNGTVYFTSQGREALQYTLGEGQLLPDLDTAVAEMEVGESRTVQIPIERAYGPRRPELIATFDRSELPEGAQPQVGQQVQMETADGSPLMVTIIDVNEDSVTIDANHPLAGQNLTFDIELVAIGEDTTSGYRPAQSGFTWFAAGLGLMALGVLFFYVRGQLRARSQRAVEQTAG